MLFRHALGMELRALRYLVAAADAGSVTKAAVRLRIAQPAISRQLQALEHEMGVTLLERTSRGVLLTEVGTTFVADVRKLLNEVESAVSSAQSRQRGEVGELKLGYAPSPTAEILPVALEKFEREAPDVQVVLQDLGGDELLKGVDEGKLDLALMVDPGALCPENMEFRVLKQYAQRVAFGRRHRFSKLSSVPLARIAGEPLVIYQRHAYKEYFETVRRLLAPAARPLKIAVECDGLTSLVAALAAGRGVALVPEVFTRLVGERIHVRPITPAPPPLSVGYLRRVDLPCSPVVRRFLPILHQAVRARSRHAKSNS